MVCKKDIRRFVKKISLLAVLFSFFITACGDSDGGANASTNAGTAALDEVYASEDDLPGCTEKYDGAVAFVKEGSTAFKCEDGRWENKGEYHANNDAIKNCTAKREGEVAYIVDEDKSLVCEDGKWVNSSNVSSSSSWSESATESSSSSEEIAANSSSSTSAPLSSSRNDGNESSNSADGPSSSSVTSCSSVQSSSSIKSSSSSAKSSSSLQSSSSAQFSSSSSFSYGLLTDSRDGKIYKTIVIGSLTWMADNLNYKAATSYCMNDDEKNCDKQGRLYTYGVANSVCPNGWRLPAITEWQKLYAAADSSSKALWSKSYHSGTDKIGFGGVPTSVWDINRSSRGYISTKAGFWWSSTKYSSSYNKTFELYENSVYFGYYSTKSRLAVRCIKD